MRAMTIISPEAKAAQDAARDSAGRFGEQYRTVEEVALDAYEPRQLTDEDMDEYAAEHHLVVSGGDVNLLDERTWPSNPF